jgi:hypothetical protein
MSAPARFQNLKHSGDGVAASEFVTTTHPEYPDP